MFTGKPKSDYPKFRASLLDAIARKIDPAAGERLAPDEFHNVVFLIDVADKYGKIKIDIRFKNAGTFRKKRAVVARDDWYDRTPI